MAKKNSLLVSGVICCGIGLFGGMLDVAFVGVVLLVVWLIVRRA